MFAWFAENLATILTILVLTAVIGIAVYSIAKDKRNKSGGCTGNCASCGMGCSGSRKK